MAYDDDQEQKEEKDDVKHSYVMLEEDEQKTIEYLMSLVEYLEQPK